MLYTFFLFEGINKYLQDSWMIEYFQRSSYECVLDFYELYGSNLKFSLKVVENGREKECNSMGLVVFRG